MAEQTTFTTRDMLAHVQESLAALRAQRAQMHEALEQVRGQLRDDERQARALTARIELGRAEVDALERNLHQLDGVIEYANGQQSGWSSFIEKAAREEGKDAAEGQKQA